jgi:hypothetical protein
MSHDVYIEGLDVAVDYTNNIITVSPGRALIDDKYAEYEQTQFTFTQGHKWGVIWIDPSDMMIKFTEGQEEALSCIDPTIKPSCFRPRPPVVQGVTIALIPLWP